MLSTTPGDSVNHQRLTYSTAPQEIHELPHGVLNHARRHQESLCLDVKAAPRATGLRSQRTHSTPTSPSRVNHSRCDANTTRGLAAEPSQSNHEFDQSQDVFSQIQTQTPSRPLRLLRSQATRCQQTPCCGHHPPFPTRAPHPCHSSGGRPQAWLLESFWSSEVQSKHLVE